MDKKLLRYFIPDFEENLEPYDIELISKAFQDFYGTNNLRYKLPIGHIDIVQTRSHISHIFFNDDSRFYEPPFTPQTELLGRTKDLLDRYFDGESVDFREVPVKIEMGTDFQNSVWNTIHQIPHGEVRSYKWIAEQIGRPKAVRAVGNATGSNPITIIIPCHRVIGSNGNLGGYGGGLERKRQLLTLEGYPVEVLSEK
ncbi:methylated-DNA--[protein]-cysteine S-methyltransferase [Candidatus Poribacteria bacterium]|nr:methylated-DNA--[protein]-cysteine S-methyltransferase [Candidatus Poribacteria bacterium]